jgi:hypothetical protein
MTPQESAWYADETNMVNLKVLLNNEVFQKALNIVTRTYRPTRSPLAIENNVVAASVHHYNSGANDALDALFALTVPPAQPQRRPQPKQLEQIHPID